MLRLRPYKACDAQTITKWLGDEYAFRQWSADRYDKYPITPDDMNLYYDRDSSNGRIWGMTAFDETVKLETTESYQCMGETWNCIEMEIYDSAVEDMDRQARGLKG